MKQYEHKCILMPDHTEEEINRIVNDSGKEGWRMCGYGAAGKIYMVREKRESVVTGTGPRLFKTKRSSVRAAIKNGGQKEDFSGYGKCTDCNWKKDPEGTGCNVARDSEICKRNKTPVKEE